MKGIFVNSSSVPYAELIVTGKKTIETRSRNMLAPCLFERVAIIETGRGQAKVIGYADMVSSRRTLFTRAADAAELTFVPEGSKYADNRWFYLLSNPEPCDPYPVPSSAIRHGRSWCEFERWV